MNKCEKIAALFAVFVFLSLSSCAYRTELTRARVKEVSASQIATIWEKDRARLRSFSGEARVKLRSFQVAANQPIDERLSVGILFKSPGQIRVEVYAGLGINILTFLQRGNRRDVFLPQSKLLIIGNLDSDPLAECTRIKGLPEIILELLGIQPQLDGEDIMDFQKVGDRYTFWVKKNGGREQYWIDSRTLHPVRKRVFDSQNRLEREITFKKYAKVKGISLPRQVKISCDEFQAEVKFIRQRVNFKIEKERFNLRVPASTERVWL